MKGPTSDEQRLVLFENKWLEKLTVVSVRWFIATWSVLVPAVFLVGWGSAPFGAAVSLAVAGWVVWGLFEYFAHRKVFHWQPKWLFLEHLVFLIHGNHHAQPRDELRNLMPPIVSIPIGAVIWSLFWIVLGDSGTWLFFGFVCGYVAYDLTHYACHHWPMRGPIGARLKRHHMHHHFIAEHKNFGVTTIIWDRVFGTRLDAKRQPVSPGRDNEEILHPAE